MKLNTGLFLTVCYTQVIHTVQSTAGKRPKLQPPSGRDRSRGEAELISAQNAFPRRRRRCTLGRSRGEAVMWEVHAAAASAFPSTEGYTASCKDEASQKKVSMDPNRKDLQLPQEAGTARRRVGSGNGAVADRGHKEQREEEEEDGRGRRTPPGGLVVGRCGGEGRLFGGSSCLKRRRFSWDAAAERL